MALVFEGCGVEPCLFHVQVHRHMVDLAECSIRFYCECYISPYQFHVME